MDKVREGRAERPAADAPHHALDPYLEAEAIAFRRDRLLAALTLIAGTTLVLALPFMLREGAAFFLPVTTALVIAIALVPLLEWFERRGLPSVVAALLCVILFLVVANIALAAIVLPATDWVHLLPERIGRIRDTLDPLFKVYASFEHFINDL